MSCLLAALDLARFVIELPIRWRILGVKRELPVHTRIGYGVMLNAITDMWLRISGVDGKDLDPNALAIVKHFIGYMNTIDDRLDGPKKEVTILRFSKGDELWERRKQLFSAIGQYDIPLQKKLKRTVSGSTYRMLRATAKLRDRGVSGFDEALAVRECTAGELARVTAELFNVAHGIPLGKAKVIEQVYASVGMIMQVYDDVGDVRKDSEEGTSENLILQMLNERPEEKARLAKALVNKKKCTYDTLTRHAPETARIAMDLQNRYMATIPETDGFERIKRLVTIAASL
ncbi:MAG TPA: class 1 isoprenoid biosynthesis enzyme, partial [Methanocella sp.]|nr:class 1 isoprenoid biosynthesis enzyme [Methanocella sp.]